MLIWTVLRWHGEELYYGIGIWDSDDDGIADKGLGAGPNPAVNIFFRNEWSPVRSLHSISVSFPCHLGQMVGSRWRISLDHGRMFGGGLNSWVEVLGRGPL